MPELPEVETIKTAIQKQLKNAQILDVIVRNPNLRQQVPSDFAKVVKNKKIIGYQRIAKYILIHLEDNLSVIIHLGMSGRIRLSPSLGVLQKHDHLVFTTSEGYMVYNDARRFGLCLYVSSDKLHSHPLFKNVGIDPFDKKLTGKWLKQKLSKKQTSIKQALLDQHIICGIGNIYASESLFLAGILPTRTASSLTDKECIVIVEKVRETLNKAILAGGSTLRDYQKPDGSLGYFQNQHCVYNKTGLPCPICTCRLKETGGIQKITQAGRSTYFCATKQR